MIFTDNKIFVRTRNRKQLTILLCPLRSISIMILLLHLLLYFLYKPNVHSHMYSQVADVTCQATVQLLQYTLLHRHSNVLTTWHGHVMRQHCLSGLIRTDGHLCVPSYLVPRTHPHPHTHVQNQITHKI